MSCATRFSNAVARVGALLIGICSLAGAAQAQTSASPYTSAMRHDDAGRVTGTISPDPDGSGGNPFLAVRTTYDPSGRPIKIEKGRLSAWQSEAVAPAAWSAFTVDQTAETAFDVLNRKVKEWSYGSTGGIQSLTQYSYDASGRLECTAQRMNPATYTSLPASACTLGTQGSAGPDRITKNIYDAAGQLLQVRKAVGTSIEQAYATYSYTLNGKQEHVIDANGNRAKLEYDGHDRQTKWIFPSQAAPSGFNPATPATALASAGALNTADYEQYAYDANGNRTSLRKRDGSVITYQYDALNRNTVKVVPERADLDPANTRDIYYGYDLRGLQTFARFDSASGEGVTNVWDSFGRQTSSTAQIGGVARTLTSLYDLNGNRTRVTHGDAVGFSYEYDKLGRLTAIGYINPADSYTGANLQYTLFNANGTKLVDGRWANNSDFAYDPLQRMNQKRLVQYPASGAVETARWNYTYNPASQLASVARTNDAFAFTATYNVSRNYAANGLNQYTAAGAAGFCYDGNGNLTSDGSSVYLYDIENRLVEKRAQVNSACAGLSYGGALQAMLRYDPAGRLAQVQGSSGAITRFLHDGDALVAEYDGAGALLRRYAHGPDGKADDPLFWFEGASTSWAGQRQLVSNHQGSVVAVALYDGTNLAINRYDEYGIPQSGNHGRFQYTGQAWLAELGMYYYKARIYSPTLGRFLQVDPIGYEDQMGLYAYVGNDPVNGVDPSGLYECRTESSCNQAAQGAVELQMALKKTPELMPGSHVRNSHYTDLKNAIKDLGSKNDSNGLEVKLGQLEEGTLGQITTHSNGRATMTIDISQSETRGWGNGAVMGHELVHRRQQIEGNYNTNITSRQGFVNELKAFQFGYRVQEVFDRSIRGGIAEATSYHMWQVVCNNFGTVSCGQGLTDRWIKEYGR